MIKKLILRNYIPLLTKRVSYIELNFSEIINILIGKNGHGKTRILAELNLLPPDNKNYEGNGYKYIEYVFNNKLYILESHTGEEGKHSFKDPDGKELNPNGTSAVQKDLVKSIFGITPLTNKILSGLRINDRFSILPETVRKDFLMELYPHDTKYATGVYDKLRQAYNETSGAIRNQTKRLVEEKQRAVLIESKTVEEIEAEIANLDKQLSDALFLQGALANADNVSEVISTKMNQLNKLVTQVLSYQYVDGGTPKEALAETIEKLSTLMDFHRERVTRYQTLMGDLDTRINGMKIESFDPDILKTEIEGLRGERFVLENELTQYHAQLENHPLLKQVTIDDVERLASIPGFVRALNNVTPIDNHDVTLARITNAINKVNELEGYRRNYQATIINLEHTLRHFDNAEQVTCPDCTAEFKPGFDKKEIERNRVELNNVKGQLASVDKQIARGNDFIGTYQEWFNSFTNLMNFITNTQDVWFMELARDYDLGYVNPDQLVNALRALVSSIKLQSSLDRLRDKISLSESRLSVIQDNNMQDILNTYTGLESLLSSSSVSLGRVTDKWKHAVSLLESYQQHELRLALIGDLKEEILELLVEEGRYELRRLVQDLIAEFAPAKDSYITALIRKQSYQSVIQSIEDNITELKDRQAKLKILSEGLCPKKGFIGKLMYDFIKTICGNVNAVIQEVWSTPLYVLPCLNAKNVLDYKFPVINGPDGSKAGDISSCSGGESEIINFAFLFVSRKYHKLKPSLFSDEFGSMMDEYHRRRFFDYLQRITSNGEVDQLFMVSHYHSEYGMLKGANLIALNTDGLTVPPDTNRNTIIR